MKKGLAALIHPKSIEDFFAHYHSDKPFVVHGLNQTIEELLEIPFLQSLSALLQSWPRDIQAHLPDVRDEASSIDTTPKDAQKLFDNGMGLLFNDVQNFSSVLAEWLGNLHLDMGLSALTYGRCMIYATPDGKGTAPHFDQNINFVLQIHGNKKWKLAPNYHVKNPMVRHTVGQPVDPELAFYADQPMPETMPEDAETIELSPGSLLFVPRGCWHSTEASSEALSLNFTFTAPTWIDLFTAALRSRLALSVDWRAVADGFSNEVSAKKSEEKFEYLLRELVNDLPNWRAKDILGATES